MKRKFKQWWFIIPPISTKGKQIIVHKKKDHDVCWWQFRSCIGTGTKMFYSGELFFTVDWEIFTGNVCIITFDAKMQQNDIQGG
jgi:hypothetical protein